VGATGRIIDQFLVLAGYTLGAENRQGIAGSDSVLATLKFYQVGSKAFCHFSRFLKFSKGEGRRGSHLADIEFFRYPPWPLSRIISLSTIGRMPWISADVTAIAALLFLLLHATASKFHGL
jgi:hypothetical protein